MLGTATLNSSQCDECLVIQNGVESLAMTVKRTSLSLLVTLTTALAALVSSLLTEVSAADRPNILFCIADDWGLHAGCYGTPWINTPAFDRVARDGMLFSRAYTPNAKCAPSRACLLTGRNSWQLKEAANHIPYFPTEFKGWAEALVDNGWNVGHTQKGWGPGEARDTNGKPRQMTGTAFNKRQVKTPPTTAISRNDYSGNFKDFLEQTSADQPWCFWYGALEPHRDYEFGSGIKATGRKLSDVDHVPSFWPDTEEIRTDLLDYAFEVEHFDRQLGLMLEELEERSLLDNTLVIVTSDHGPPFPRSKGNVYEIANHVPLAIMWKNGIPKTGRKIQDFVSFTDIAPTLLEIAGISPEQSGMAEITGRSLVNLMQSADEGMIDDARNYVLLGKERTDVGRPHDWGYPTRGIIKDHWLYIRNFEPSRWPAGNPETGYMDCDAGITKTAILRNHRRDAADPFWQLCFGLRPKEELYDLESDPDCVNNLAAQSTSESQRRALENFLTARLTEQQDPRMSDKGIVFDQYPHASKGHVGFYERFTAGEPVKAGWIDPDDIEPSATADQEPPN